MSKFKNYSYTPVVPVLKRWFPIYLMPYVCLTCQKVFKYEVTEDQKICPQCSGGLIMLNRKFKTPKQSDNKEWQKVSYLIQEGFYFQSVYEEYPNKKAAYPKTLKEAFEFVKKYKPDIQGQK